MPLEDQKQRFDRAARLKKLVQHEGNRTKLPYVTQILAVLEVQEIKEGLELFQRRVDKVASEAQADHHNIVEQTRELQKAQSSLRNLLLDSMRPIRNDLSDFHKRLAEQNDHVCAFVVSAIIDIETTKRANDQIQQCLGDLYENVETLREDLKSRGQRDHALKGLVISGQQDIRNSLNTKIQAISDIVEDVSTTNAKWKEWVVALLYSIDARLREVEKHSGDHAQKCDSPEATAAKLSPFRKDSRNVARSTNSTGDDLFPITPPSSQHESESAVMEDCVKVLDVFHKYRRIYQAKCRGTNGSFMSRTYGDDKSFIHKFLRKLHPGAASFVQSKLLERYPDRIKVLTEVGRYSHSCVAIDVDVSRITFRHVEALFSELYEDKIADAVESPSRKAQKRSRAGPDSSCPELPHRQLRQDKGR